MSEYRDRVLAFADQLSPYLAAQHQPRAVVVGALLGLAGTTLNHAVETGVAPLCVTVLIDVIRVVLQQLETDWTETPTRES